MTVSIIEGLPMAQLLLEKSEVEPKENGETPLCVAKEKAMRPSSAPLDTRGTTLRARVCAG